MNGYSQVIRQYKWTSLVLLTPLSSLVDKWTRNYSHGLPGYLLSSQLLALIKETQSLEKYIMPFLLFLLTMRLIEQRKQKIWGPPFDFCLTKHVQMNWSIHQKGLQREEYYCIFRPLQLTLCTLDWKNWKIIDTYLL